jgi:hypothetical protein
MAADLPNERTSEAMGSENDTVLDGVGRKGLSTLFD